MTFYVNKI